MRVTADIPDGFVAALVPEGSDASRVLLEEAAAAAYRAGRLTMEQLRVLLGLATRMEVDAFLGGREIYDYTTEEFHKDLDTLARLEGTHRRQSAA